MKLPKKIKLFGKTYTVVEQTYPQMAGTVGNITYVAQIINIDNDKLMARESVAETLLHEIIHIIDEELSLKMGEDNVGRMSVSIYSLLRDNPNLWKVFKNA